MKMDGRRESVNVEDRRTKKNTGKAAGIGIGGVVIALLAWFFGGQAPDISSVVETVQSTASSYIDSKTEEQMARYGKNTTGYNQTSVRLELQADFFAGVWAYHDNKMFGSLEDGDIEEALNAAAKIGDDYLQKQAYGRTMPETFNHGTSAQRSKWLKKGLRTGDVSQGDTFSPPYNSL